MQYVGITDLIRRWKEQADWTPQGSRKATRARDFPAPEFVVNRGKTKVWFLPDIVGYEKARPEFTSAEAKRRKVHGYAVANLKKLKKVSDSTG